MGAFPSEIAEPDMIRPCSAIDSKKFIYLRHDPDQGQCLATCMSLLEREKDLFAGHFRGNFLGSRAWRKLCACPTASNKQY
jgi:hypothetical protein